MLAYARKNNAASNIEYRRLAFEELDDLEEKFDVITSSLAFDYVENFERLMKQIYSHLNENGKCVFSMSHPISTAYDGTLTDIPEQKLEKDYMLIYEITE